ncbi:MAG: hypothetical protein J07HB67_00600, partial [halophilic archaeon J07HB67]
MSSPADVGETAVRLQRGRFSATPRFTVGDDPVSPVEIGVDDAEDAGERGGTAVRRAETTRAGSVT